MSRHRPIIGVAWTKEDYSASIERAGADVRKLDPQRESVEEALRGCDGLLLTGGEDVDPRIYGRSDVHPTVKTDDERDAFEIPLARAALARGVPVLAICRGMQLLNVAAGGTLYQDLPSEHPSDVVHRLKEPKDAIAHDVSIEPNSVLHQLLRDLLDDQVSLGVNSRHHQAVKDIAPGFLATARASDGIVEAMERRDHRFCVSVQWHPENFWPSDRFGALFRGFVDAARTSSSS
jgi:putative glutamine amidotransferase